MDSILSYPLQPKPENHFEYERILSDFLLTGDLRVFRANLSSEFGSTEASGIYTHVVDKLLGSHDLRYLWRAVAFSIRYRKPTDMTAMIYRLNPNLVDKVLCSATDKGIEHIQKIAQSEAVLEPLSVEEEAQFLDKLTSYARRVVFTKLKFLIVYDTSLDTEDYIQTLLIRAMSTIWRYSYFPVGDGDRDSLKVLNYAKASIHNMAMSLIRTNTSDSKARIKNHMESCGTCPACVRGEKLQCYYAAPAYEATTVSVDAPHPELCTDNDAVEARIILARMVSTDPRVASAMMQAFGSTNLDTIISRVDTKSQIKLLTILRASGVTPEYLAGMA